MNTYYEKFLEEALKGFSPSSVYQISPTTTLFVSPNGTYVLLENQEARVVLADDIDTIIDDILIHKHHCTFNSLARGIQEGRF